MKLAALNGSLVKIEGGGYLTDVTIDDAQGVIFQCPKCYAAMGGPAGTHYVLCWFDDCGVPDSQVPGPGRWLASGSSIADLTLNASKRFDGKRSIQLTSPGGCGWHGYVTNGDTHE